MVVLTEHNVERFMAGELSLDYFGNRISRVSDVLGLVRPIQGVRVTRALVALEAGAPPELVAKYLDWKDFEDFCANLLTAKGFTVSLDLRMRKPRAQIDVLARSSSSALLIDCKHWAREKGQAGLRAAVEKQTARATLLRKKMRSVEPMAVVILSLADEQPRYVDGAAVVPVRTLRDFLDNLPSYSANLTFY